MRWRLQQPARHSHDWHRSLLEHAHASWQPPGVPHLEPPHSAVELENLSARHLDPRIVENANHLLRGLGFPMPDH